MTEDEVMHGLGVTVGGQVPVPGGGGEGQQALGREAQHSRPQGPQATQLAGVGGWGSTAGSSTIENRSCCGHSRAFILLTLREQPWKAASEQRTLTEKKRNKEYYHKS